MAQMKKYYAVEQN